MRGDNLCAVWVELSLSRDDGCEVDRHGVATRTRAQERHVHRRADIGLEASHYHIRRRQLFPIRSGCLQDLFQVGKILVPELQSRRSSGISAYVVGIHPTQLHTSVVVTTKGEKMDAATLDLFLWRLFLLRGVDNNLTQNDLRLFPFNQV